ncbi:hypothetical protein [Sulfuracidifex tepidarius]|nr:hypothetical protein [Sulfuracidifex tepidarius]
MQSNTISPNLRKILLMIIGVDLIGLSVFYYSNSGSYTFAGYITLNSSKYPIYWYLVHGPIVLMSIFMFTLGIATLIVGYLNQPKSTKPIIVLTVFTIVSAVLVTRVFYLGNSPSVVMLPLPAKTDEYVIQMASAFNLVHGINPYEVNLEKVMLSSIPPQQFTLIYSNSAPPYVPGKVIGFVDYFDYLPQAALYYVPAILLGIPGVIWNALVYSSGLFLSFRKMKGSVKYLFPAVIAGSMFIFLEPAVMPVPSAGWIVPLLIAVSYPEYPILSGIMLGWASAYKIYVLPFALFYLVEAKRMGYNVKKMIYGALASFLGPTLPFLVEDPSAMLKDVLAPLTLNLRPLDGGPGITDLQFLGIFIPKDLQIAILAGILVSGLFISLLRRLGYLSFVIPSIAFFWWYRPEPQYFMYFPFIALIAVMTGFFGKIELTESRQETWLFSSFSIGISAFSVMYLAQYAFIIPAAVSIYLLVMMSLTVMFVPISIMIERAKSLITRLSEKTVSCLTFLFMTVAMVGIALGVSDLLLNGLWFVVMGHNYESDAFLLSVLAAKEMVDLHNPYSFVFLHDMLESPQFGKVFSMFRYSNSPIDLNDLKPSPVFTPYLDPSGQFIKYGARVNYVDFYDYPPGMALSMIPALLLRIPVSLWESLLYVFSIVTLFLSIRNEKNLLYVLVFILSGVFVTFYGEAFESDLSPWISLILIAISFRKYPLISGALTGFAATTMPEATVLVPFILILIYNEMGKQFFLRFLISGILLSALLVLPPILIDPSSLTMMFFPILAKLPVNGVSLTTLISLYIFHSYWPVSFLSIFPYVALIGSIAISVIFYNKIREGILMFPVFIVLNFTRAEIEYFAFYPLVAFLAWLLITREKEITRSEGLKVLHGSHFRVLERQKENLKK